MLRRPRRSTLFPYTTLFRSMDTETPLNVIFWTLLVLGLSMRSWFAFRVSRTGERILPDRAARQREGVWPRSEEHTSELQSHVNLVCRLLLEKKKKTNNSR